MRMNTEKRESFRVALLRVMEANNTIYGLGLAPLGHLAGDFGFAGVKISDLEREIVYLQDKGYAVQVAKPISPENRIWRITAEGRDYLAQLSHEG